MLTNAVLVMIVLLPLGLLWLMGRIVWTALFTGRLLARGVIYDRDEQPIRYWLGIWSWILMFCIFSFVSLLILSHWPSASDKI
jgi:hypothetical protein